LSNEGEGTDTVESEPDAIELKEGHIFDPVARKLRKGTDEEYVRQEMIKTLVSEYGYPLSSMATEFKIKIGSAPKKVDIAVFPDDSEQRQEHVLRIIECKRPQIKMNDKQDGVGQLISYVSACPACPRPRNSRGPRPSSATSLSRTCTRRRA